AAELRVVIGLLLAEGAAGATGAADLPRGAIVWVVVGRLRRAAVVGVAILFTVAPCVAPDAQEGRDQHNDDDDQQNCPGIHRYVLPLSRGIAAEGSLPVYDPEPQVRVYPKILRGGPERIHPP